MVVLSLGSYFYFCVSRACSAPIASGILMERRMGESNGIDSLFGGWAMPKAYSGDAHLLDSVQDRVQDVPNEFKSHKATTMIDTRIFGRTEPCR
jgi:hypothetical protein